MFVKTPAGCEGSHHVANFTIANADAEVQVELFHLVSAQIDPPAPQLRVPTHSPVTAHPSWPTHYFWTCSSLGLSFLLLWICFSKKAVYFTARKLTQLRVDLNTEASAHVYILSHSWLFCFFCF